MSQEPSQSSGGAEQPVPKPQGQRFGVPYDLRKPTLARTKSRW